MVAIPVLLVLLVLVLALVFYGVAIYNALVRLRNGFQNAWSQIEVQLKRRHDLIPNLVETAKQYMKHERETLEGVTQARARAVDARGVAETGAAEGLLSGALGRLLVVAENYPDLKANQNFLALHEELTGTENKIAFARQHYNDVVLSYNNKIQMFPSNLLAGTFGFAPTEFFELEDAEDREAPAVKF